ncbi:PBS lyase HEAT-like repeat [Planktothrix tepida]|uniref:PBS lyase HEAT-like repeat n=2 Tax=Planktothrix TaxID=54304 RepID=A0A1J1LS43_9CYAN|nr:MULTISPECIES: HEAT repeat domain-containing protein [Planktothrix]CAD5948012.1 PBS lyase HEAT-like repeat [Planktothrix pseudagardhii]CAD5962618.1 PBS lyase HEAT-like repeat [Planktothrix tepida]CUR34834.1 PBS lyase HEAT-like repeat [Planktothrix tepida PCC 9214]
MTITPESVQNLLISSDLGDRLRGVNQLRELEPAIAFELIQIPIKDSNSRVRYAAVSQMATLGEQNLEIAYEILSHHLLNDPEVDVQAAAADGLGALKLKNAFDDLQTVYNTTSEWLLKLSIVAAVGGIEEPRAFELLEQALQDENTLIQTVAISALGELGDHRAIPLLVPFVTNSDWQVRYRVAQALVRLGGSEAETLLRQLAEDEVEIVAQEAKSPVGG